jgi:methylthioribose-1-phosphate isomerase
MKKNAERISNVNPLRWKRHQLDVLEQRKLPLVEHWRICRTYEEVAQAIEQMSVRGAPAIGITAAYGVALQALQVSDVVKFKDLVLKSIHRLARTRPTAVNLFYALNQMENELINNGHLSLAEQKKKLEELAVRIHRHDESLCSQLGHWGAQLLQGKKEILTYCNTGSLATGGEGTALAAIKRAAQKNKQIHVWACETRPYFQGSRLTAYELAKNKIDFHIITDNVAASLMKQKRVEAIIVGADRIVANGDTANKIGTYSLAVLARMHQIPFYVSAPRTTLDFQKKQGSEIQIELRNSKEVICPQGRAVTCENYPAYNPAFDVTPGTLITAIILETGICYPPYRASLKAKGQNLKLTL